MKTVISLAESGYVPDLLVRLGIRRILQGRVEELRAWDTAAFVARLADGPVARVPEAANDQHYEVPPAFFEGVLGPHLKYSCCLFEDEAAAAGASAAQLAAGLEAAELAMLVRTCETAQLEDGQDVLELGCGWGSLSLFMAARYPGSRVVAVSNSAPQRRFIEARAAARGLTNLRVHTADMNAFDPAVAGLGEAFDRVVSVEMIEHMWSWQTLLARVHAWLRPGGAAFIHHFHHTTAAYPYEDEGEDDWMARNFFSGGIMPSADLLERTAPPGIVVEERQVVDGRQYAWTSEAWLARLDARRGAMLAVLAESGHPAPKVQLQRWRMFFLAVAELFAWEQGRTWAVTHARLRRSLGDAV